MKCFNHPDIDAVAQCWTCWINTCKECCSDFTINNKIACKNCYEKLNTEIKIDEAKLIKDVKFIKKWWKFTAGYIVISLIIWIIYWLLMLMLPKWTITPDIFSKLISPIVLVWVVLQYSIFYCVYRVWKYIPWLMKYFPIVWWSWFFIAIVFLMLFMLFFFYWIIYSLFVFPIKYRNYWKAI
jgi:hypothetical protein